MRIMRLFAALTALCLLALCAPISGAMADSHYYITVDLTNQIVTVYDSEKTDDINIVRQMICSTGRNATPTPKGTFRLPSRGSSERSEWYYFPKFKCYAKWATRITGGILFHSTLFSSAKKGPTSASTRALGSKASHGCVRLKVNDAKFIAQNCGTGTKCRIFASGKTNNKLRNKLKKKTFIRDNQTYDSFLGRKPKESPLPLSKGSTGSLVTQLQTRLKELGFYNGEVNGAMGKTTVAAVRAFSAACGMKQVSSVNQALWDTLFGEAAPTGTLVTLQEGSTGPAVQALENNLITLLMLNGAADATYDAQTAEAVKSYQNSFNFPIDGVATGDIQTDAAERAAKVRQEFGDTPYALSLITTDAQMAKVKAHSGVRLRQSASKKGKTLKKLKYKSTMRVLNDGKTWVKVRSGVRTGFVKRSSLKFYTESVTENGYVKADPPPVATSSEVSIPTETGETSGGTVAAEAGEAPEGITPEGLDPELIYDGEPVEDAASAEAAAEALDSGLEIDEEAVEAVDDAQGASEDWSEPEAPDAEDPLETGAEASLDGEPLPDTDVASEEASEE